MATQAQKAKWQRAGAKVSKARDAARAKLPPAQLQKLYAETAAHATVCVDCFTPLSPQASVTMVDRTLTVKRKKSRKPLDPEYAALVAAAIAVRGPPSKWQDVTFRVPVCLHCWLMWLGQDAWVFKFSASTPKPNYEYYLHGDWDHRHVLYRMRCLGCDRPIRITRPRRWISPISLRERCCCTDCVHRAELRRASERRLVRHDAIDCTVCGKPFVPRRTTAKVCSNTCRQRAHRQRHRNDATLPGADMP
jgi:hypothetical protein